MKSLPNILTVFRILLVPVFAFALWDHPSDLARLIAFALFAVASVTDWLDGYLARKWNAGSDFGRMLDPIADKILVGVALMVLVAEGQFDGWKMFPALIIISREFLVSGLREFLAKAQIGVPVTYLAKIKTTIQMIALAALIVGPAADKLLPGVMIFAYACLWIAAVLTVITGYAYLKVGIRHTTRKPTAIA